MDPSWILDDNKNMNIRHEMQHFTALQIIVYKSFKTLRVQILRGQCNRGGGGGGGGCFSRRYIEEGCV